MAFALATMVWSIVSLQSIVYVNCQSLQDGFPHQIDTTIIPSAQVELSCRRFLPELLPVLALACA